MAIETKWFKVPEVQELHADWIDEAGIKLKILRLDLIHPVVSGNKWFKLKRNIALAQQLGKSKLLTFGGIWSNHLVATAAAAQLLGLESIGLVRGFDEKNVMLTETLKHCLELGMQLKGISRERYRDRYLPEWIATLQHQYPFCFIIPEGGNNEQGREGAQEIAQWIPDSTTHVALTVGTGTTLSGIRKGLKKTTAIIGFAPFLKIDEQLNAISKTCGAGEAQNWKVFPDLVWGGFAKRDEKLILFMNDFFDSFGVPLDVIYTAKMMYYLKSKIERNQLPAGSEVLAVHSGGLQGNFPIRGLLHF